MISSINNIMNAKISVITISYNAEKEIEKTILSVITQTYDNIEYIIVDGASKDNTISIVNKYKKKISCVISEPDKGIYDAMNKGVMHATGEWLIMMNAGDVFCDKSVLQNIMENIPENKTFLYSNFFIIGSDGKKKLCKTSFIEGHLNHQSIIYKRILHQIHGMYIVTDKLTISDYLFFIRVPKCEVAKIETPIAIYDTNGISNQSSWTLPLRLCADVVMHRRTLGNAVYRYLRAKLFVWMGVETKIKIKRFLEND